MSGQNQNDHELHTAEGRSIGRTVVRMSMSLPKEPVTLQERLDRLRLQIERRQRDYTRWYADDGKRLEVVVRFLERMVNRSLRKEPGTITERLDRVMRKLRSRGRGRDYDYVMMVLSIRAKYGSFGQYRHMALKSGLKIGTVKQTLRRLDRVAYELFSKSPRER